MHTQYECITTYMYWVYITSHMVLGNVCLLVCALLTLATAAMVMMMMIDT